MGVAVATHRHPLRAHGRRECLHPLAGFGRGMGTQAVQCQRAGKAVCTQPVLQRRRPGPV
jgi:hypothetical protein